MTPRARGITNAALSALVFGATAPAVERFGRGAGPFATALLLYLGSLAFTVISDRDARAPVRRADAPRVALVGILGAAIAPASLAWGLQRSGATSGALTLNLEAVFTVVLARLLYREPIGRRMIAAVLFIVAGGALLPLRSARLDLEAGVGLVSVALATFAWALDGALSRPLAHLRARSVVRWKSLVGILLSSILCRAMGDRFPSAESALGLFGCGVIGYGLCLKLYMLAQRDLGAARTGAIFGFAPLGGAAIAFALGDRGGAVVLALAFALVLAGAAMLATEQSTGLP